MKVVEKGQNLNGFAKSHFISQDAVTITVPVRDQPVERFVLKVLEESVVLESDDILSLVNLFRPVALLLQEVQIILMQVDLRWFFSLSIRHLSPILCIETQ